MANQTLSNLYTEAFQKNWDNLHLQITKEVISGTAILQLP
jgi:hypothetical protein